MASYEEMLEEAETATYCNWKDHVFEDAKDWPELPVSIIDDYNEPFTLEMQYRQRHALSFDATLFFLWQKHYYAQDRMDLVRRARANPGKPVHVDGMNHIMGYVPANVDKQ